MEQQKKKVLIMTCSHGSGHKMIASTLKAEYDKAGCETELFDVFREFNVGFNYVFEKAYLLSYGAFGWAYKYLYYHNEDNIEKDFNKTEWYWGIFKDTVLDIIRDFKPDLIVNTYSYRIVSILKKEFYPEIPVVSVVTEFCMPGFWVHPDTDRYYVACEQSRQKLISEGIAAENVVTSGIPVRSQFRLPLDREYLMMKYGLDPGKTTLIIFAGTYGVLKNLDTICEGIECISDLQTVVVCGKNRKLKAQLKVHHYKNIQILGYVADIHELFCCGDFMVTKPGGTVLSEIVAAEMPVILYDPVPGQELENAELFRDAGAALIAKTSDEVFYHIMHLKGYKKQQESMKAALRKMNYGDSAKHIVTDSIRFSDDYQPGILVFPEKVPEQKLSTETEIID
ncbi:MAG: MGDG synthase family glycosyltransferase [Eubacteriaceae bacterium]